MISILTTVGLFVLVISRDPSDQKDEGVALLILLIAIATISGMLLMLSIAK